MKRLLIFAASALSSFLFATDYTFVGTDGDWNKATNWTPEGVPGGGDTAIFTSTTTITSPFQINDGMLRINEGLGVKLQISGVISGNGGIIHKGKSKGGDKGTLDLCALNTFTGPYSNFTGAVKAKYIRNAGQPSSFGAGSGENAPLYLKFDGTGYLYAYDSNGETDRYISYIDVQSDQLTVYKNTNLRITGGVEGKFWVRDAGSLIFDCPLDEKFTRFAKTDAGTVKFLYPDNTFDLGIKVSAGNLYATKLANIGETSSLGKGDTIELSQTDYNTAARLYYSGSETAECNKNIKICVYKGATDSIASSAFLITENAGVKVKYTGQFTNVGTNKHAKVAINGKGDTEISSSLPIDFGIYKQGLGTGILSGDNLATGLITVAQGRLDVNGKLPATRGVIVKANAKLGGSGTISGPISIESGATLCAGGEKTIGTLTLDYDKADPVTFKQNAQILIKIAEDCTSDIINIKGKPVLGGPIIINFESASEQKLKIGTYEIITFDEAPDANMIIVGTENVSLSLGEKGIVATVLDGETSTKTWKSDAATTAWDFTSPNWVEGLYADGNTVKFTDAGSVAQTIDIKEDVAPSIILVNNDIDSPYVLTGKKIIGQASLQKRGEGSFTLANTNSFNGFTQVEAGTLSVAGKIEGSSITVSDGALLRVEETGCIAGENINLYFNSTPPELLGTNTFTGTIVFDANNSISDTYYRFPHPGSFGNADKIIAYPHTGNITYLYLTNSGVYTTPIEMVVRTTTYHGIRLGTPNEANIPTGIDVKYYGNITAKAEQDVETLMTFYANKGATLTIGKEDGSSTINLSSVLLRGNATHDVYAKITAKTVSRNDSGTTRLLGGTIECREFSIPQGYVLIEHENAITNTVDLSMGKDSVQWGGNHSSHLILKNKDLTIASLNETNIGKGGERRITTRNGPATLTVKSDTKNSSFGSISPYGDGYMTGELSLVKDGEATFDLNSTNSFTGSVTLRGGVLNARARNALGLGNLITVENGTLALFDSNAASTNATLRLEALDGTSGTISLADGVNQQIEYLEVNGEMRYVGTYGSLTSAATYKYPCFTGNGILTVNNGLRGLTLFIK